MAAALIERKLGYVNSTGADDYRHRQPGLHACQLRAGVDRHGHGQRVLHVIELLDEAYGHSPATLD